MIEIINKNQTANFPEAPCHKKNWPWACNSDSSNRPLLVKKDLPKITIVTPSYNQGNFLEETIRSVLLQGYPNIEYIVIDGGSTDNSLEIISKYSPWITYWISEPDGGQADAINKGLSLSTGEYLGWINSDDYLYPDAIWKVIKAFQEDGSAEMIYGDVDQGWSDVNKIKKLVGKQLDFRDMLRTIQVPIPQQGCLWRRQVIDRVGSLDPRWHVVLDREFFTRVAGKCQLRHLPETLGFFRYHEESKSISQSYLWLSELPKMYLEIFEKSELTSNLKLLKPQTMGMVFLTCSDIAFKCGHKISSFYFILLAFKNDPFVMFRKFVIRKIYVRIIGILSKRFV